MTTKPDLDRLIDALMRYETRADARLEIERLGPGIAEEILALVSNETLPQNMRWAAMMLLATWRYEPALPVLLTVMRTVPNLRTEASRAMEKISGLSVGDVVEDWEKALINPAVQETAGEDAVEEATEDAVEEDDANHEEMGCRIFREGLGDIATKLEWEDEGYLYLRIPLEGGRKQQVVVTFNEMDPGGNPLATIYTECGPASSEAVESISHRNTDAKYGKFLIEGEEGARCVVMRETVPLRQLDRDLARDIVLSVAQEADSLELELTGSDHI